MNDLAPLATLPDLDAMAMADPLGVFTLEEMGVDVSEAPAQDRAHLVRLGYSVRRWSTGWTLWHRGDLLAVEAKTDGDAWALAESMPRGWGE